MLTGQELLSFVKANKDMDRSEIAREAGYVRVAKDGTPRLLLSKLQEALLATQGIQLQGVRKPGKKAQFITTVHCNGGIMLGKTYSEKFGLEPGDQLRISIEDDSIRLLPLLAEDAKSTESCVRPAA